MGSFPVTSVAREAVRHDQREAQAPREVGYPRNAATRRPIHN